MKKIGIMTDSPVSYTHLCAEEEKREHVHLHMLPSACAEFDETKRTSCDCTSNWFPHGKEQRLSLIHI